MISGKLTRCGHKPSFWARWNDDQLDGVSARRHLKAVKEEMLLNGEPMMKIELTNRKIEEEVRVETSFEGVGIISMPRRVVPFGQT